MVKIGNIIEYHENGTHYGVVVKVPSMSQNVIVAQISSQKRSLDYALKLEPAKGLPIKHTSYVNCDNVCSIDKVHARDNLVGDLPASLANKAANKFNLVTGKTKLKLAKQIIL